MYVRCRIIFRSRSVLSLHWPFSMGFLKRLVNSDSLPRRNGRTKSIYKGKRMWKMTKKVRNNIAGRRKKRKILPVPCTSTPSSCSAEDIPSIWCGCARTKTQIISVNLGQNFISGLPMGKVLLNFWNFCDFSLFLRLLKIFLAIFWRFFLFFLEFFGIFLFFCDFWRFFWRFFGDFSCSFWNFLGFFTFFGDFLAIFPILFGIFAIFEDFLGIFFGIFHFFWRFFCDFFCSF